jgi:hypothetical protein
MTGAWIKSNSFFKTSIEAYTFPFAHAACTLYFSDEAVFARFGEVYCRVPQGVGGRMVSDDVYLWLVDPPCNYRILIRHASQRYASIVVTAAHLLTLAFYPKVFRYGCTTALKL